MASRFGQHLFRAKSKTENFGLFALCSSYFFSFNFYLLFGCLMANAWLLSSKQSHSPNVQCQSLHLCYQFLAKSWTRRVGSLHLTECPVSFDHNSITPQIAKNTLPRLKPSFSKLWKCPPLIKLLLLLVLMKLLKCHY